MAESKQENLADYVRRVRGERRLSLQEVEDRSRGGITDGYVSKIENGQVVNVTPKKLRALALGLGVEEAEVIAVATGRTPARDSVEQAMFRSLGYDFAKLSRKDKEVLRPLLEMIRNEINKRLPQ